MNRTGIEYLDFSWNPIAMRCAPISEGCANCWHQRMADRLKGNKNLPFDVRRAYAGEGPPVLVEERLVKPLRRKKAARIGTQFMGDLSHENVPLEHIGQIFDLMMDSWTPETPHTYLLLTKRPKRMLMFLKHYWCREVPDFIWLGVSVENSDYLWRVEELLKTPAAVRFVSLEPLLGPVDLEQPVPGAVPNSRGIYPPWMIQQLSWAVVGGESGPGARPMHPDWARSVRDQCQAAGVPFFFKQWGACMPYKGIGASVRWTDGTSMLRVGKKRAGRLLDGALWEEYPV